MTKNPELCENYFAKQTREKLQVTPEANTSESTIKTLLKTSNWIYVAAGYHPISNTSIDDIYCDFSIDDIELLSSAMIWKTYVVLSEIFIRLGRILHSWPKPLIILPLRVH